MLSAIALPVLLGLSGIALDVGNWYLSAQRAQRAADSAALDGAIYLPSDPVKAAQTARRSLVSNEVPADLATSADVRTVTGKPAHLRVEVQTRVQNTFLPLIGFSRSMSFERSSTGVFKPALGSGRFSNVLGDEPGSDKWRPPAKRSYTGGYWAGMTGPAYPKDGGDRFQTRRCTTSGVNVDGCSGNRNAEARLDSADRNLGHDFTIEVPKGATGDTVAIEVFDPATSQQGYQCDSDQVKELYARTKNPLHSEGYVPQCTGDDGPELESYASPTNFTLRNASTGAAVNGCPAKKFGTYGSFSGKGRRLASYATDAEFNIVFRKWVRLCTVPYDPTTGLKLTLNVNITGANDDSGNNFSIRAGLMSGGTLLPAEQQTSPRVYGNEHLVVQVNYVGAETRIPLSTVPPSYAGDTVEIELFDIGDATAAATLSLAAEASAPMDGTPTKTCDYTDPNDKKTYSLPGCSISNLTKPYFNGKLLKVRWHVPNDYTCDVTEKAAGQTCTLFVRVRYPAGSKVFDMATWKVRASSAPVRLVDD